MKTIKSHQVWWQVSLSNGKNFTEYKYPFEEIEGERSPFLRLVEDYIPQHKADITSLVLCTKFGNHILPSAGTNPKFRILADQPKPIGYDVRRKLSREMDVGSGNVEVLEWYTVGVAMYDGYELQIWVNENNPKSTRSFIVKT